MQGHGVECIDCFAVDNALIKPASPSFIGYCHSQGSDCGEAADLVLQTPLLSELNQISQMLCDDSDTIFGPCRSQGLGSCASTMRK